MDQGRDQPDTRGFQWVTQSHRPTEGFRALLVGPGLGVPHAEDRAECLVDLEKTYVQPQPQPGKHPGGSRDR